MTKKQNLWINRNFFAGAKRVPALVAAVIASVSVGTALIATPAIAAPAQNGTASQFGVIDMLRIIQNSKPRQQAFAEIQRMDRQRVAVLNRLRQGSAHFLTAAEINELGLLYEKEKPTEIEQKRISQLEDKGDQVRREITTLQNTPTPNEAQSARLTAINELQTQGDTALQTLETTMGNRLQEKYDEAGKKVQLQEREVIAKVAKGKKLSVVFQNDVAFYTTIDITEDVLKELSK